jgi:hypothetical protein
LLAVLQGATTTLGKRLIGIPKLEDANNAGTKDASKCTLIITVGIVLCSLSLSLSLTLCLGRKVTPLRRWQWPG